MTAKRKPTGPTGDAHNFGEPIKVYRLGDTFPCCGCEYHGNQETGPCTCRCHETARMAARFPDGHAA